MDLNLWTPNPLKPDLVSWTLNLAFSLMLKDKIPLSKFKDQIDFIY